MSSFEKYRVHEVAKDFGTTSKVITEILTQYATTPKNHMQVLETRELDVIFEYLTQKNQIENIAEVFADTYKEPVKEEKKSAKASAKPSGQGKAAAPAGEGKSAPAAQSAPKSKEKESKPKAPRQAPEKRIIDTRGSSSTNTNLSKYDEKFENLAGDRAGKQRGGKEKFTGNRSRQRGGQQSSKRRQEEKNRISRLHLEIAKKQPLKVMIPDEISVGELATRM